MWNVLNSFFYSHPPHPHIVFGYFYVSSSLMTLKDTTVRVFHFFWIFGFFEKLHFETDEDSIIEIEERESRE